MSAAGYIQQVAYALQSCNGKQKLPYLLLSTLRCHWFHACNYTEGNTGSHIFGNLIFLHFCKPCLTLNQRCKDAPLQLLLTACRPLPSQPRQPTSECLAVHLSSVHASCHVVMQPRCDPPGPASAGQCAGAADCVQQALRLPG